MIVGVGVIVGIEVGMGVEVGVLVGKGEAVMVGFGVFVGGMEVAVGTTVYVGSGVYVGKGLGVEVIVGRGLGVEVGCGVLVVVAVPNTAIDVAVKATASWVSTSRLISKLSNLDSTVALTILSKSLKIDTTGVTVSAFGVSEILAISGVGLT